MRIAASVTIQCDDDGARSSIRPASFFRPVSCGHRRKTRETDYHGSRTPPTRQPRGSHPEPAHHPHRVAQQIDKTPPHDPRTAPRDPRISRTVPTSPRVKPIEVEAGTYASVLIGPSMFRA